MIEHSFLQSDIWGAFRESLGWHAHKIDGVLLLERKLPFNQCFLYSPEVVARPDMLVELLPKLYRIAKERQAIFYRLELLIDKSDPLAEQWQSALAYTKFRKAFESVQPEDRQIVSLTPSEETILAQMKPKGRYNIRLAEKAGVLVRESTEATRSNDIKIFYQLMQETAKRDKFAIRPLSYFEQLTEILYQHNCGRLFIATYQNQPTAGALITLYEGVASYLYGASSQEFKQVMAPYALHWSVIEWAKTHQAHTYDLLAIRPPGDKKHRYDGITRFKQQFGGDSVHLLGSWDLVLKPIWYTLFKFGEELRR